jgi:putative protein kinase ArgK-like GTPase of G3E family
MDDESGPLLTRRPGTEIEPRTFLVSAEQGQGLEALVEGLEEIAATHGERWQQQRLHAIEDEVRDAVLEEAARQVRDAFSARGGEADPVAEILEGRLSVEDAAARLLQRTAKR